MYKIVLSLLFFIFCIEATEKTVALPKVAIVITGGTIVQTTDSKTGASVPTSNPENFIKAIPQLREMAQIEIHSFSNIDSSQMTLTIWKNLSILVNRLLHRADIAGVVIVHGTDTMVEGTYFLDLTLTSNKPVVFVGAMRNASDPFSDGPFNLVNGVTQVISKYAYDWGVTLTMDQKIHSAFYVEKTNTTNIDAFGSGDKGLLGYVVDKKVYRLNDRLYRMTLPLPDKIPTIDIIYDHAGADGQLLRYSVDRKVDGIVVESVGAGNVKKDVFEAILYALSKNIPVVIATRVPCGGIFPLYGDEGGGAMLKKAGAIVVGNHSAAKAAILLALAIPLVKEGNHQKLYQFFDTY